MVSNGNRSTRRRRVNQAVHADIPKANKIGASTPYGFQAHNLTAYGGLLPVATMLEKLGFQQLIEKTLTVKRQTRAMPMFRFILGMVLACYVGFSRLRFLFLAAPIWRHAGAWASATATITRRRTPSSASRSGCEAWHAGRMDLLPFSPRRYAPDLTAEIAHGFLCTGRTIDSITCRAGLGKSKTRGDSEAQANGTTPPLNRSSANRVLKLRTHYSGVRGRGQRSL